MKDMPLKDKINKSVGEQLKKYRKRMNYTQEKMAELIDVSSNYITILENGKGGMSMEILIKLSRICGITPNELLQDFIPNYMVSCPTSELNEGLANLDDEDVHLVLKLIEGIQENKKAKMKKNNKREKYEKYKEIEKNIEENNSLYDD